jgi:hypothetical protein
MMGATTIMRIFLVILLAAALGAACGDEKKGDADKAGAKTNSPAKPPAGLKPMGANPHAAAGGALPPGIGGEMPALPTPEAPEDMSFEGITKPDGGYTIEELFAKRTELSGKVVMLRGRVVKFSPEIMGTNWVHVQDGTGAAGTNDLTVTTPDLLGVGDVVVVEGPLAVDEVLGHGMKYPLLIQGAKITIEKKD